MARRTLICGLPSSGNHVIADIVKICGGNGFIYHGDRRRNGHPRLEEQIKEKVNWPKGALPQAIWPVRALVPWRASIMRRWGQIEYPPVESFPDWDTYVRETTQIKMRTLSELGIPVLQVTYEGLVAWPEGTVREICAFLNLEPNPEAWGIVRDENAKYHPLQKGPQC